MNSSHYFLLRKQTHVRLLEIYSVRQFFVPEKIATTETKQQSRMKNRQSSLRAVST